MVAYTKYLRLVLVLLRGGIQRGQAKTSPTSRVAYRIRCTATLPHANDDLGTNILQLLI